MNDFWKGVVCGPILLLIIIWFTRRLGSAYRRFYEGMPIVSWFGMWLIVVGLKIVRPRHMSTFKGMNRHWLSPNVKAFKVEHDS